MTSLSCGYETKCKTCATLGLQPTEQKMMEAMDKYATGKNESNKTSKKKRKKQKKNLQLRMRRRRLMKKKVLENLLLLNVLTNVNICKN